MLKIVSSLVILTVAFAAGVVLGAKNSKPKIQHFANVSKKPFIKKTAASLKEKKVITTKTSPTHLTTATRTIKKTTSKSVVFLNKKSSPKFLNIKRKGYTVLLSSFKVEENADNYAKKVAKKGYDAFYFSKSIQGKVWHGVGVGSFTSRSTAESLKKELTEKKLGKGFIISEIPSKQSF